MMAYLDRNLHETRTRNALISGVATVAIGTALVSALTFTVPARLIEVFPPATNPTPDQPPPEPQPQLQQDTAAKHNNRQITTVAPIDPLAGQAIDQRPFLLPPIELHPSGDATGDTGPRSQPEPHVVSKAREPIALTGNVISTADYPSRAINLGEHGATLATFTIAASGRVISCTTDGQPSTTLAKATCAIIMQRFRFQPALSDDGKPVAQVKTQRVSWVLPDE